jgi:hypothetical protein
MSTLKELLDRVREGFKKEAPPEVHAVMDRARQGLAESGIMDRILKVGDRLPAFALPDTGGATVESSALLARGPLAIAFYRGVW